MALHCRKYGEGLINQIILIDLIINIKIRTRIQRTDVGKFFVNRTIVDWNDLPATVFEPFPCSARGFRKKYRKLTNRVKTCSEVK